MDLASVDELLTTTRSVRKRLDLARPVEPEVLERCLDLAIQAPTASNAQGWHFVIVADPAKRAQVAKYYKQSFDLYIRSQRLPRDVDLQQMARVRDSSTYLSEHMAEVPVLVIPCVEGRAENAGHMAQASLYGSILPAAWSFMLALRARGLGSAWTTLHLRYAAEVAGLLGIPDHVTQAALLPVAYLAGGALSPARRRPARERTYWDAWGRARA